ncbi:MAG: hypothetical protein QXP32_06130 [Nitrososphaeria archaeon]
MTLVLALKWISNGKESIVISSDSKATAFLVSYEEKKIHPIYLQVNDEYVPIAVAGGSGDSALVKQCFRIFEKILEEKAANEWNKKTPTFEQFEKAIKEIETALIRRFKELKENNIMTDISGISLILASVDANGKASMYQFDSRGIAEPLHDSPGYAMIGAGFVTGGILLLRLLGYTPEESYKLDLGTLSTFIIDTVSEVDPTVGPFIGESYHMRAEEGKVLLGPLKDEALKEFKEKTIKRKEIIKKLWQLMDSIEEQKIIEKIEELDKLITEMK